MLVIGRGRFSRGRPFLQNFGQSYTPYSDYTNGPPNDFYHSQGNFYRPPFRGRSFSRGGFAGQEDFNGFRGFRGFRGGRGRGRGRGRFFRPRSGQRTESNNEKFVIF